MPQIFRPGHNVVAKISLMMLVAVPGAAIVVGSALSQSPYNTGVHVGLNQPVPFSHRHHSFELGIDCRFCHSYVEKSRTASVPATDTCMTCHSQIWTNSPLLEPVRLSYATGETLKWNKVNWVPEFVYFDHSIHINRGVNCNTCHGPVQDMAMTFKGQAFKMVWCLQCHREPEKFLTTDPKRPDLSPRQQVFDLYWKFQSGEELTPREYALLHGNGYKADAEEIEVGKQLVKERSIIVRQLSDCYTCHR